MSDAHHENWRGNIRKLWPSETDSFRDHLLRLDRETRRLRFAHIASDSFIQQYAAHMLDMGSIVYGHFVDGEIHAAAELRKLGDRWGRDAEAAFSVEKPYQNQGIGSALMGRIIISARNRGINHLYMSCLAENRKMQAIALHHEAQLQFEYGEVIGEIIPNDANYFTLADEVYEDRMGYMLAVLDIQRRITRAA